MPGGEGSGGRPAVVQSRKTRSSLDFMIPRSEERAGGKIFGDVGRRRDEDAPKQAVDAVDGDVDGEYSVVLHPRCILLRQAVPQIGPGRQGDRNVLDQLLVVDRSMWMSAHEAKIGRCFVGVGDHHSPRAARRLQRCTWLRLELGASSLGDPELAPPRYDHLDRDLPPIEDFLVGCARSVLSGGAEVLVRFGESFEQGLG